MIKLTLPCPPTDNHCYTVARGRKILSAKGRDYKNAVKSICQKLGYSNSGLSGGLVVSLLYRFPDNRRRDLLNFNKTLIDALAEANIFLDDSQINALSIVRGSALKPGEVVVTIATQS